MSFRTRLNVLGLIGLGAALLSGCSRFYMVRDPSTSNAYFTKDVDDAGRAGAIRFKDERTCAVVTLPTSEVTRISPEQYRHDVKQPCD